MSKALEDDILGSDPAVTSEACKPCICRWQWDHDHSTNWRLRVHVEGWAKNRVVLVRKG